MARLSSLPTAPDNVRYALTVPQSVLFADLSLRGSLPSAFQRVFDIQYEPRYIVIDDGAMSWDFSHTDPFNGLLSDQSGSVESVVHRFLEATGRTARHLVRRALIVAPSSRRRNSSDLLEDLGGYWNAYEDHMTSLYTFWNVETLLTDALIEALRDNGFVNEIEAGLPTYIRPSEPNWFSYEQENLLSLQERFGKQETPEAVGAAGDHARLFGFLLAPFNLTRPPSAQDVVQRIKSLQLTSSPTSTDVAESGNVPESVSRLGQLERQLSFWKTERLDAFAQADQIVAPLYEDLSKILGMSFETMFSMTRDELASAVQGGETPSADELSVRLHAYCLALIDGSIDFYQPTEKRATVSHEVAESGAVLVGAPASPGVVRGRVHIVQPGEIPELSDDEIIVTQMTRPDMGAALDKALAYVTDEGGRLSHAAIVSREKNKPCVVALGNATEVLRQGMYIEVDGSAGTVKVLDASFLDKRS